MDVLRKLFGPSKEEIWQQLTKEIGGHYIKGDFWDRDKIEFSHAEWTITLDSYFSAATKADYTRMRALYVNPDGFRFTIYRHDIFSDIGKWFGMQDVEVGYADFDRDFIIKGTDEAKLKALFGNPKIRALLMEQPQVFFTVQEAEGNFELKLPTHADELCFTVPGVIKDVERLKHLFDLFSETLDQLCHIGSAYENVPKVVA